MGDISQCLRNWSSLSSSARTYYNYIRFIFTSYEFTTLFQLVIDDDSLNRMHD